MAKVIIDENTLHNIGDAIREKEGSGDLIPVSEMANRIGNLTVGGNNASGYKVKLNTQLDHLSGAVSYSLDDGSTWEYITESPIVIINATTIKFSSEYSGGMVNIGTTNGGSDIYAMLSWGETDNIILNSNTNIYLTRVSYDF